MEREKLVNVLGMLGNNHDGEVLSAARKAQEILSNAHLTWDDVIARDDSNCMHALLIELNKRMYRLSRADQKCFIALRENYFKNGSLDDADARRIAYFKNLIDAADDEDLPF